MNKISFEQKHAAFIDHHMRQRTGERKDRLARGHRHGEKLFLQNVWWPLKGNFDALHPEYEVLDWRNRSYFADLAWLPGHVKLLFEIKGFASHVRDMDRSKYCGELNREIFLHAMGYYVISFAYDDVEQHPELCTTLLRMVLSRYEAAPQSSSKSLLVEKEVLRFAIQLAQPIRPIDVEQQFQINHRTAVRLLQNLCEKGWIAPVYHGKGERIGKYELVRNMLDLALLN